MQIKKAYQIEEIVDSVKKNNYSKILATNLKKIRLAHYNEYKKINGNIDNPYSVDNIASVLDISRRHYTRLENPNYITKNITMEKLIILAKIYEISLDTFFKDYK